MHVFSSTRHPRRGFTAIEVTTAIVIGLIVSIIGFSGFRIFQHRQPIKSTTDRLSYALSTARSFAINQNSYFQLTLDLDNKNFWIDEITDPALATLPPANIIAPKIVSPEAMEDTVTVEQVVQIGAGGPQLTGLAYFIFRPDGSAERDARIFLHMVRDDPADPSNIYTVRLYGPTGHNEVFARQRI